MIEREEIEAFDIFYGLQPDAIDLILSCSSVKSYNADDVIIEASSLNTDLYILMEGRVSVEIEVSLGEDYKREQIVLLRKGDVFGEVAFLEGKRRSAYVVALDDIRALKMDGQELYEIFDQHSRIGYRFMENLAIILAQRLIDTNFMWRNDFGNMPGI
jgi:CRP-like cAMP-binding protein